jgi:hypothetical protein
MLRRASRMAEQMFDQQGNVETFYLVETASGEQRTLVTPMAPPPGYNLDQFKRELTDQVRKYFATYKVVRYARALEGWMRRDQDQPAIDASTAAGEIVLIDADDGGQRLIASRDIIRPQHGKTYLGKLSKIEAAELGGRLDIFAPRPTSDLPDDEGIVFVTDVSGGPFQVFGRRGNTGELFVRCIFRARREAETGMWLPEVEIVTGPEAERLIRSVQRHIEAGSGRTRH